MNLKRAFTLVALVGAGVALWDYPFLWPLKLLVVMIHETGHALAALLVGGTVSRVTLAADQSGECLSMLPQGVLGQVAVYSGGYVGSAVASALLLALTYRFQLRRAVLGAFCAWLAVMGVLYAGDAFTVLFCLGTATLFGLAARFLPASAVEWLNLFIAAFSALYAAMDLKDDLWNSAVRDRSDAALLAGVTGVPALIWAALWTVASLAVLGIGASWSVQHHRSPPTSVGAFDTRRTR
jgi:hypothetical protein